MKINSLPHAALKWTPPSGGAQKPGDATMHFVKYDNQVFKHSILKGGLHIDEQCLIAGFLIN